MKKSEYDKEVDDIERLFNQDRLDYHGTPSNALMALRVIFRLLLLIARKP